MKVFEVCMLIIKRRFATFLVYFAVFMALSVVMTVLNTDRSGTDFSAMKPNFTVINRDVDSPLADGLKSFLRGNGVEIVIRDEKGALQDATFFRSTDYIVFLPQGFRDDFLSGGTVTLENVKSTHSAHGYYTESLVNQYMNQARVYLAAGVELSEEELVSAVLADLSIEASVEKKQFGVSAPIDLGFLLHNQMLCYILLLLIILCVTNISMVFKRPDLRMRNLCAPLKPRSSSIQQMLCSAILSVLAWILMTAIGFILYGSNLGGVDIRVIALIMLNSLVFTFVALSVAALGSSFVRSPNSQNAAANIIALGLCFLGGVFVPTNMLGEGILNVARFLPTFWNVTALDRIVALTSFEAGALWPVWQAMLIQLAFAVVLFCVTMGISRRMSRSERYFSSIRTEMEA